MTSSLPSIGQPMPRIEDARMLTGRGRYADDHAPDAARLVVVRSPHAHARIRSIDTREAVAMPGVVAVLTGADWQRDGWGGVPCVSIPPNVMAGKWFRTPFPALEHEIVRCVGHAVAIVVAGTAMQAADAAERVLVNYEPLPAAPTVEAAIAPGAAPVWPDRPDNFCFVHEMGDRARTDAALAAAHHVTRVAVRNQRVAGNPLEMRCATGAFDTFEDRWKLVTSTANPHRIRQLLAEHVLKLPAHRIHVISRDVGGGFGTKGGLYPEEVLVLWAARKTGRTVKWTSDRSEAFLSDFNGRDQVAEAEMGFDSRGRITAFRVHNFHNLGCQAGPSGAHPPLVGSRMLSGVYDIPAMHVRIHGVLTHSRTLTTYRGAGRPESTYLVERTLDIAAAELGIDAIELRRRNLIRPEQMPYRTAIGEVYDSGEFGNLLDHAIARSDASGYATRKAQSATRGLLRGRGIALYIEVCATLSDRMEIRFDPTGGATVLAGSFSYGQGHETMYTQMLGDWFGLPPAKVRVVQGDTDTVAYGRGSFGSRTMTIAGSALRLAADQVIARGSRIAAHLLEAAETDITFARGQFTVAGTDRAISLEAVARTSFAYGNRLPAELSAGLQGEGHWLANPQNYPNGCYIAEVEVDPETGTTHIDRLWGVDDVGVVMNPLLLEGQMHGAIAQAIGQALTERVVHDEAGQVLSGSFMDYAMPRADDMPMFDVDTRNIPTRGNPLGVKGGAETGTVGAPPAIIRAILDALAPLGVRDIAMPATPARVWEAIRQAQPHP